MNNPNLKGCSGEFTLPGSVFLKQNLADAGIRSNSPLFASIAAKHHVGEESPEYQYQLQTQGSGENWTEYFIHGFSPWQVQRIINGQSASLAGCKAVGLAFTEVTGLTPPALATDPLPFMQQLAEELAQRVTLARQGVINDLENPPEFHYARLVPLKDKEVARVQIVPVSKFEAKIQAVFRDTSIQVGLIIVLPSSGYRQHSIVYAPEPYRWTGAEVVVGRKKIRSIQIKKDRVQTALLDYLKSCQSFVQSVS